MFYSLIFLSDHWKFSDMLQFEYALKPNYLTEIPASYDINCDINNIVKTLSLRMLLCLKYFTLLISTSTHLL